MRRGGARRSQPPSPGDADAPRPCCFIALGVLAPRCRRALIVVAGLAATAAAAVITASGPPTEYADLEAVARALMVATPIAVGLYARAPRARPRASAACSSSPASPGSWRRSPSRRTAWVYSVGRVFGWVVEVTLMYVILAFPTGRLPGRVDRVLVGATALVVAVLFLPTALLVEAYPIPAPWADCSDGCPGNAFMLVDSQPAFVDDVVRPLREVLVVALFAAATARVAWRMRGASALTRRALGPVLAVAVFRLGRVRPDAGGAPHRAGLAARRRRRLAGRAERAAARPRVPGRRLAVAAVHGRGDAAPGDPPARASGARRAAVGARRRVRATPRWTSCTGSRTARAAGRTRPGTRSPHPSRRRSAH